MEWGYLHALNRTDKGCCDNLMLEEELFPRVCVSRRDLPVPRVLVLRDVGVFVDQRVLKSSVSQPLPPPPFRQRPLFRATGLWGPFKYGRYNGRGGVGAEGLWLGWRVRDSNAMGTDSTKRYLFG